MHNDSTWNILPSIVPGSSGCLAQSWRHSTPQFNSYQDVRSAARLHGESVPSALGTTCLLSAAPVLPRSFVLLLNSKKPRRVVVKDVPLLFRRQKIGRLDGIDRQTDGLRPFHLIRTEHQAIAESRLYQT